MLLTNALGNARYTGPEQEKDRIGSQDTTNGGESFASMIGAINSQSQVVAEVKSSSDAAIDKHNSAILAAIGEVPDAKKEFMDFMSKTPAERMRIQILHSMGLTEESLKALPPEKQAAIEKEIADIIKEKMARGMGEEESQKNGLPDYKSLIATGGEEFSQDS